MTNHPRLSLITRLTATLPVLALAANCALAAPQTVAPKPAVVSTTSLLAEMTDADNLARFPEQPYRGLLASSYARESTAPGNPAWFANTDWSNFIRKETVNGHNEYVMMDDNGPGAIVRLWTAWTGLGKAKFSNGTLRIYLDGQPEPVLAGPIATVFNNPLLGGKPFASIVPDGNISNPERAAHNLFLPLAYAKSCKVTYEPKGAGTEKSFPERLWYQVHFRKYAEGTPVQTFKAADLPTLKDTIARAEAELSGAPVLPKDTAVRRLDSQEIAPGAAVAMEITGPAALRTIRLTFDPKSPAEALTNMEVQLDFDGIPCVRCPAGYFFAVGQRFTQNKTWLLDANNKTMACHWVMPFAKQATMRLVNKGTTPVTAAVETSISAWNWDARSMHFHAVTAPHYNIMAGGNDGHAQDLNYADVKGRGRHVGDSLFVRNSGRQWWGEGDEKIHVDGETFPSQFGTGTEDYYGYAWSRPETFLAPFHAQPYGEGDAGAGLAVNTRLRLLDDIVFTQSFKFDMELWHWNPCKIDWVATTFYYVKPENK